MKKTLIFIAAFIACAFLLSAKDKAVTFDKLPEAAKVFIKANYPDTEVVLATVDDDFIRPDYEVVFSDGTKVQFEHSGDLDKITTRSGVPQGLVPYQITDYVKMHYPGASVIEYEIGRKTYEVKLSNRMELKFNSNFNLIEIDD